ncbi:MAG: aspartyl protease family protein [Alphaproteobacteria bacterium]|nr:aspartyl protease family protein [Alphaproteobacteria bacterium]
MIDRLPWGGFLAALALLVLSALPASADSENCKLERYASLPIAIESAGRVTVPVSLQGEEVNLLVDTGGVFSMISRRVVDRLKLHPQMIYMQSLQMFGGRTLDHFVTVPEIKIGAMVGKNRDFVVIPDDYLASDDDGILATDILAAMDVDFDMAGGKVALFSHDHCEGKVVYWTHDPYAAVPFKLDDERHMKIDVTLDGKDVPAFIDTGSFDSAMSLETAADIFGLDVAALKKNDGRHAFKLLSFDGVAVANPNINLIPDEESKIMGGYGQPKLLIGMGILRQLHFYIAFRERVMYVTPADAK